MGLWLDSMKLSNQDDMLLNYRVTHSDMHTVYHEQDKRMGWG